MKAVQGNNTAFLFFSYNNIIVKQLESHMTMTEATKSPITRTYTFISDPGHGWLSVPFVDLVALNIQTQISAYSYVRENSVYLEEDLDYSTFLNAAQAAGWNVKVKEGKPSDKPSPVRSYPSYSILNAEFFRKIAEGMELFLYSSSTQSYSTKAKISEILKKKIYVVDVYGNHYKPMSPTFLIRHCQMAG